MLKKALLIFILATSQAFAQKDANEEKGNDKLDIKKLEEKYWAAKDDDFTVVQNRRYTKAERFYGTLFGGIPINDPFGTGTITSAQVGYFFNERWGVDFNYTTADMKNNDNTKQFIDENGVAPNYNFFKNSMMVSATYVPLYAKMSFLDRAIIYFDMGVSLGLGTADYIVKKEDGDQQKSAMSYQIGINQQIFFSEHFSIRMDFINKFTNEDRTKYSAIAPNRDLGPKSVNDTQLLIGVTYWH